jgi:hypothetical protein
MNNKNKITKVKESVDRINQYNINPDLITEYEVFLLNSNLNDTDVDNLNKIIERMISQHYVKQLLMQSL